MKRPSYRDQDLAFGQMMLTLRTAVGLTQAGLADFLQVSRHAIGGWEAGQSYPKTDHLKRCIELCVAQHGFAAGNEAAEIRALWRAARQKVLLDEAWLEALLDEQAPPAMPVKQRQRADRPSAPAATTTVRLDWGDAPDGAGFYGRADERARLSQWIIEDHCRVVSVLGLGGTGKSSLVVTCMRHIAAHFDTVIWRSLRDAPACEALLNDCLQGFLPNIQRDMPTTLEELLSMLLQQMREQRVLLVLDNFEALLEEGTDAGRLPAGSEGYAQLLQLIGGTAHQSCLLLTSRERLTQLLPLEGNRSPVRSLRLVGLDAQAGMQLLADKDVVGSQTERGSLVEAYQGNPLALKIVAQSIVELFGGEVALFLAQGEVVFGGVRQLLDEQFSRLSMLGQAVCYWLAILREPVRLEEVGVLLHTPVASAHLLDALESLNRRSLVERGQQRGSFTLQSVVLEYVTGRLLAAMSDEIQQGKLGLLIEYALCTAQANDYVRKTQEQLLVRPILAQLQRVYAGEQAIEARLLVLLDQLRDLTQKAQGYGPANLAVMVRMLRGNLRGLDLSRLSLRGASLHGIEMQDAQLTGATLRDSVFTEAIPAISAVAVSGTGEYWAAGTWRGEVWVWKAAGPTLYLVWQAHSVYVSSLAFSPDGTSLASASWDNTLKMWDVTSGTLRWAAAQTGVINCVTFAPNGEWLASAGADATIYLWNAQTGAPLQKLAGQTTTIFWLACSPDGRRVAASCLDGTIWLWSYQAPDRWLQAQQYAGHDQWVAGLAFAPDGAQFASASFDGTIKVWDTASGACRYTLSNGSGGVLRVAWSPDGATLASCTFDHAIVLWNVTEARPRAVLRGHGGVIYGLGFTPDGRMVISGSDDGSLRVWDVSRGQGLRVIGGYVATLFDLAWSPDSVQLASAGADAQVMIWNRNASTPPIALQGHSWVVQGVAWSPNGKLLASGGYDNRSILWDTSNGGLLRELRDHDAPDTILLGVAWHPDGRLLASGTYRRGVYIWDTTTAERLWIAQEEPALIRQVAWSPDGRRLAGTGDNGYVWVWHAQQRTLLQRLDSHSETATSLAWSPDGRWLASGGGSQAQDGEVFVWDAETGERVHALVVQRGIVYAVIWSGDGRQLISGSNDGVLRWWDLASGVCVRAQTAHRGTVQALALSPDGRMLASCGDDGAIVLWDAVSGEHIQTLRRDRPYERLDITGIKGLSDAQKTSLRALGAVDTEEGGQLHTRNAQSLAAEAPAPSDGQPPTVGNPNVVIGLPFQPTAFVGRDTELSEIARRLADPACRLLTLLGPGGVGKTRLAIQLASVQTAAFADGVVFVPLASVDASHQIVSAIAGVLGLPLAELPNPTASLLGYLRERHMLFVLDNVEHLLDGGAELVATILAQAPKVTVIVTSRERLHVQAEWLFDVGGLAYPPENQPLAIIQGDQAQLADYSAVQLFAQRVMQVQPALVIDEAGLLAIVHICQRVAGMPLAIELAAATVRSLSLAEIEQLIDANLDLLQTTMRDVPARHRSLRAVFDHSWKLLDEQERALWSRLAVFRGGWTAAAAMEVAGTTPPVLSALADKSLVRQDTAAIQNTAINAPALRWTLLESLREYALEQLVARNEAQVIQRAHAQYFMVLAEAVAAQWATATHDLSIAQLQREYDNVRAALAWVRDSGESVIGLRLAEALWQFWRSYGYISEGRVWLEQLLALDAINTDPNTLELRQHGMHAAAWLASDQHDYAEAKRLFEQSAALRQAPEQTALDTDLLLNAARQARTEGQYGRASAILEQALAWHRAHGHTTPKGNATLDAAQQAFGQVLRELGLVTREQGNFARASTLFHESMAFHHAVGDRACVALALIGLADVARDQGNSDGVREYGEPALLTLRELGMPWAIGFTLHTLALGAYYAGDIVEASALIRQSEAVFRGLQSDGSLAEILITTGKLEQAQGNMAAAYTAMVEALRKALAVGPRLFVAASLEGLATLVLAQGHAEQSVRFLAMASALRLFMSAPLWPADQADIHAALAASRSMLGDEAYATLWAQIHALSLDHLLVMITGSAQS